MDVARERGWEGLIAKHVDSLYKSGKRTPDWRKIKITQEQEFVVGGFTDPQGVRKGLGALLVGYFENDDLVYAGKLGTGFDTKLLLELRARLDALEIPQPPFTKAVGLPRLRAHFVVERHERRNPGMMLPVERHVAALVGRAGGRGCGGDRPAAQMNHLERGVTHSNGVAVLHCDVRRHWQSRCVERMRDRDRPGRGDHRRQGLPVIGVLMRRHHTGNPVGADQLEQRLGGVRGVDEQLRPGAATEIGRAHV